MSCVCLMYCVLYYIMSIRGDIYILNFLEIEYLIVFIIFQSRRRERPKYASHPIEPSRVNNIDFALYIKIYMLRFINNTYLKYIIGI